MSNSWRLQVPQSTKWVTLLPLFFSRHAIFQRRENGVKHLKEIEKKRKRKMKDVRRVRRVGAIWALGVEANHTPSHIRGWYRCNIQAPVRRRPQNNYTSLTQTSFLIQVQTSIWEVQTVTFVFRQHNPFLESSTLNPDVIFRLIITGWNPECCAQDEDRDVEAKCVP